MQHEKLLLKFFGMPRVPSNKLSWYCLLGKPPPPATGPGNQLTIKPIAKVK